MGIQRPLHGRGLDHDRFARLVFHLCRHMYCHQRRHAGGPGHPDVAFLPRQAEYLRLGRARSTSVRFFFWIAS